MGKLEGQIERVPSAISQQLFSQSKEYLDSGNTTAAINSFQFASELLVNAKNKKVPVGPNYFDEVSHQLRVLNSVPELAEKVHSARQELADYRSALQPPVPIAPNGTTITKSIDPSELNNFTSFTLTGPGEFFADKRIVKSLDGGSVIAHLILRGASPGVYQSIEGFHWIDITFINVLIKYGAGDMELRNVRFVNCTFEVVPSERGSQVLEYAILSKPDDLVLGQKTQSSLDPGIWNLFKFGI
jgi:hypothetical protein